MKGKNGKPVKKAHLPEKACAVCGRAFAWRRRWQKEWESVKYCSAQCRSRRAERHSAGASGQ